MPETDFDITCPYCKTHHELADSIDCSCGAHGHRRLQGMLLGWFWSLPTKDAPDPETDAAKSDNESSNAVSGG